MNRFDRFFAKFYLVFGFLLICFFLNEQDKRLLTTDMQILEKRLASLSKELKAEEELHQELLLQKSSRNDPAWKELVLMNELGVIPEGFTQVVLEP